MTAPVAGIPCDVTIQHGIYKGSSPTGQAPVSIKYIGDCYPKCVLSVSNFNKLIEVALKAPSVVNPTVAHYIDGVYTQLRPSGWLEELRLGGEWDEDAHFLLDGVIYGFRVIDPDADLKDYKCHNYNSALVEPNRSKLQDLILEELENGKMSVCHYTPTCIHALGVIVKPSGAIRPITDCKRPIGASVNSYMQSTFSTFSYVTVDDAINLMTPKCWMSCVDLQSAYRSVNIHPSNKKFCGLSWDFGDGPVYLTDNCVSFGQRSAPFIFARLTDFVTRNMCRRGYRCLSYLDDFFLVESSKEKCTDSMNVLMSLLRKLGFYISYKKLLPPSQSCKFLGVILDSVNLECSLPQEKMDKLSKELAFFNGKKRATLHQLQRLTGTLCHASKVVYGGRPYTQRIIETLRLFKDERDVLD